MGCYGLGVFYQVCEIIVCVEEIGCCDWVQVGVVSCGNVGYVGYSCIVYIVQGVGYEIDLVSVDLQIVGVGIIVIDGIFNGL